MEETLDIIISDVFVNNLLIASGFSIILFAIMQKIKELPFITNNIAIWVANLVVSMVLGIPYAIYYFELPIPEAIVVGLLSFVGAPAIYTALKSQNVISYTPKSLDDDDVEEEIEITFDEEV